MHLAIKLSDLLTKSGIMLLLGCLHCLEVTVSGKDPLFCSDDSRNKGLTVSFGGIVSVEMEKCDGGSVVRG